ncbi:MAG: substrate-binding domain-containing protein [Bacillota bacterium]|nr:substrate-binding domain-containing protein [Bacillota bacterium]
MDNKKKEKKAMPVAVKIVLTLVALGVSLIGGILLFILLLNEDLNIVILWISLLVLPTLLIPLIWVKKKKKFFMIWLVPALIYLIVVGGDFLLLKHDEAIKVNTSEYRHYYENSPDYYPFEEDSDLVRVENAKLQLTDNLPKIDGATALLKTYSSFVDAVYPKDVELFEGLYNNTSQSVDEYLSEWGYKHLAQKDTDIFFDMYPGKEGDTYAEPYGVEFEYTNIGTEALVFFVHKDNPIDDLTSEQIKGIYSGEITEWEELGGDGKKIKAYQSDVGSCSQVMMNKFMAGTPLMDAPTEKVYDELFAQVEEISPYRNRQNSIGYAPRHLVLENPDLKFIAIDGVEPTIENVKNGSYNLVTPIYATTCKGNTNKNIDKLLKWILTDEGQYIIEESGYIGVVK